MRSSCQGKIKSEQRCGFGSSEDLNCPLPLQSSDLPNFKKSFSALSQKMLTVNEVYRIWNQTDLNSNPNSMTTKLFCRKDMGIDL